MKHQIKEAAGPQETDLQRPCGSSQMDVAEGLSEIFNVGIAGIWDASSVLRTYIDLEVLGKNWRRRPLLFVSTVHLRQVPSDRSYYGEAIKC